jgi:hypothetical protein
MLGAEEMAGVRARPKTLKEAVSMVLKELEHRGQTNYFKDYKEDELVLLHHGMGRDIRNDFGLWGENAVLIAALREEAGKEHADDMSSFIIKRACMELQADNCIIIEKETTK